MQILSRKNWRQFFVPKVNPIIKTLIFSDLLILSGFGLISPIFAVFITNQIKGGSLEVAGLAATIYLVTKSLGQIPVGDYVDKIKGERDDFRFMLVGSIGFSLVPFLYLFLTTPAQLYLVQLFYGLATALTFPSWMAIFTRHIDSQKEGLEWGTYYTLTDLGGALSATVGGILAQNFGFRPLFVLVGILSLIGSLFLLTIKARLSWRTFFR